LRIGFAATETPLKVSGSVTKRRHCEDCDRNRILEIRRRRIRLEGKVS
jgi:hypothetical protein